MPLEKQSYRIYVKKSTFYLLQKMKSEIEYELNHKISFDVFLYTLINSVDFEIVKNKIKEAYENE